MIQAGLKVRQCAFRVVSLSLVTSRGELGFQLQCRVPSRGTTVEHMTQEAGNDIMWFLLLFTAAQRRAMHQGCWLNVSLLNGKTGWRMGT
jgi:hypothetical protein